MRVISDTLKDIDMAFKALEERDELLDKIRAEIASYGTNSGMLLALETIDKYRGESI